MVDRSYIAGSGTLNSVQQHLSVFCCCPGNNPPGPQFSGVCILRGTLLSGVTILQGAALSGVYFCPPHPFRLGLACMYGPYYPHSDRGVNQAKIIHNGEELLKKTIVFKHLELLENNCFLRRIHRKVTQRIVFRRISS